MLALMLPLNDLAFIPIYTVFCAFKLLLPALYFMASGTLPTLILSKPFDPNKPHTHTHTLYAAMTHSVDNMPHMVRSIA